MTTVPAEASATAQSKRGRSRSFSTVTAISAAKMALVSRGAGATGPRVHTRRISRYDSVAAVASTPSGRGHSPAMLAASGATINADEARAIG
jgi:hypothetical protein